MVVWSPDGRHGLGDAGHLPGSGARVQGHAVHHPERGAGTVQGGLAADPDIEPVARTASGIGGVLDAHARDEALEQVVHPGLGLELEVGGVHLKSAADHILAPLLDAVGAHDEGVFKGLCIVFQDDVDPAPSVDPDHLRLHPEEGELQFGGFRSGQDGIGPVPLRDGSLPVGGADDADAGDRFTLRIRDDAGDREPFLRRQPGG